MDGQYWKGDRTMSTNEWLLTSDFWQFIEPWHGRWYENEIFIASCTDNICDLENERWLLGDMIDHVGMYGSGVAEGLSAFSVGLVLKESLVGGSDSCFGGLASVCQRLTSHLTLTRLMYRIIVFEELCLEIVCLHQSVWSPAHRIFNVIPLPIPK